MGNKGSISGSRTSSERRKKINAEELHKKREGLKQGAGDLRLRAISDFPLQEAGDSEDSYFMGFAMVGT